MRIDYYDIGVNLFCRQFPDPEKTIADAAKANVACILTGTDQKENQKIHAFTKNHAVYGTAGIHPHNADSAKQEDFIEIEEIITGNKKIVAVGECGLDYDRMFSTKENQIRCLEKHIALAEKLDKPLFLHELKDSSSFEKLPNTQSLMFCDWCSVSQPCHSLPSTLPVVGMALSCF